jgi:hypothetical protein
MHIWYTEVAYVSLLRYKKKQCKKNNPRKKICACVDVLSVELWYNITKLVHFKCTENIKKGKQRIIA